MSDVPGWYLSEVKSSGQEVQSTYIIKTRPGLTEKDIEKAFNPDNEYYGFWLSSFFLYEKRMPEPEHWICAVTRRRGSVEVKSYNGKLTTDIVDKISSEIGPGFFIEV